MVFLRGIIMLHLAIDSKDFSYLNYLAVMSAMRFNDVTMWYRQHPEDNKYWDIVKKTTIKFKEIDPVEGITLSQYDYTGRLDIIYISPVTKNMVSEAIVDHNGMYEDDGEFKAKDMCLVRVFKPELITPEYVKDSKSAIAQLIRKVLFKRVWNV